MPEIFVKSENSAHFETHHEDNGEVVVCMGNHGECSVLVEVTGDYGAEQQTVLAQSAQGALAAVDELMGGRSAQVFAGLHIKISETPAGGGEAKVPENEVLLKGSGMLMSLGQMRSAVTLYRGHELRHGKIVDDEPGGALKYTLTHEMGHILAEHVDTNQPSHPGLAAESPTAYGREPDEWHSTKDNEAFADGFAHMVWDMPVTDTMRATVQQTIEARSGKTQSQTI